MLRDEKPSTADGDTAVRAWKYTTSSHACSRRGPYRPFGEASQEAFSQILVHEAQAPRPHTRAFIAGTGVKLMPLSGSTKPAENLRPFEPPAKPICSVRATHAVPFPAYPCVALLQRKQVVTQQRQPLGMRPEPDARRVILIPWVGLQRVHPNNDFPRAPPEVGLLEDFVEGVAKAKRFRVKRDTHYHALCPCAELVGADTGLD